MAEQLKAVVFMGSVREGRNADRVTKFVKKGLEAKGFEVSIIDPKLVPFPLLERPLHFYPDQSKAPQYLLDSHEQVKQADAVVLVTTEYNRLAPPALLNILDHFSPRVYAWKAALTVSYSLSTLGGVLGASSLLPLCRELGLQVTPTGVTIASVTKALDAEGQLQDGFPFVQNELDVGISQLAFLAKAMKAARADPANVPRVQPYC